MGGRAGGGARSGGGGGLQAALRAKEYEIAGAKVENIAVFDDNGKLIASATGTDMKVGVHYSLQKDRIVTHNHPHGGSFSEQDVTRVPLNNPKEIRLVSDGYRFSIKRPAKGWASETTARKAYQSAARKIKKQDSAYELAHSSNYWQAGKRVSKTQSHRIVKEFAKQMGYTYTKTKM